MKKSFLLVLIVVAVFLLSLAALANVETENENTGTEEPAIIMASGGGFHSLALKDDGTVWSWGRNFRGRLGDGTTEDRHSPVQVSGLTEVEAISAGGVFSLALKKDGTVWAWGSNSYGQLGDGTTDDRHTPVKITSLSDIKAISAGHSYSLTLKGDGTVWAWGSNSYGQLGNGTTENRHIPVQVSELQSVQAISAKGYHSIALKGDGKAWSWGYNYHGQLGDHTTENRHIPVQISGLSDVQAISAGSYHSMALKNNGTVFSWGANRYGQLGDYTVENRHVPEQISSLDNVQVISAGQNHSLVLKDDSTIWARGNNEYGQLGDGTTEDSVTKIDLAALTVKPGNLNPEFDPKKTAYTVPVAHDVEAVDVAATLADKNAVITINGESADSGEVKTVNLKAPGTKTEIDIVVHDPIELVFRQSPYHTNLVTRWHRIGGLLTGITFYHGLHVRGGSGEVEITCNGRSQRFNVVEGTYDMSIYFSAMSGGGTTLTYTFNSPHTVSPMEISRSVSGTITGMGLISLSKPESTATANDIEVAAEDSKKQKTYTVTVDRKAELISDATLSALTVEPGELEPAFDPGKTSYSVNVGQDTSSIEVTATLSGENAAMTINGDVATSGETINIGLNASGIATEIEIVVTTEDGGTTNTYNIIVNRAETPDESVTRLFGEDRYITAVEISKNGWANADIVFLARADDYADALAGVPLAYQLDAPILLTQTADLNSATKSEIARLGAGEVILLGGTSAISDTVKDELEANGLSVDRIAGTNRYETAAKVAKRLNQINSFDTAFIAVGTNFADALAASSYAAIRGEPILLTETDRLLDATGDALDELGITSTYVCGGEAAVSNAVFNQLKSPTRKFGDNRYDTGLALAEEFLPDGTTHVGIATGLEFPDAVAGGVWAAKNNTGILLVNGGNSEPGENIQKFLEDKGITEATLFGGPGAVRSEMAFWLWNNLKD